MNKGARKLVGVIGDALATEIFSRSQKNLASKQFAERSMSFDGKHKKIKRRWSISNTSMLSKSGYKKGNKRKLEWTVGYTAPHGKDVDIGSPPHWPNFEKLYDWAWYRRKEPDFPSDLPRPTGKNAVKLINKYRGKMVGGHRFEWNVFNFTYYVATDISENGVEPSFFFTEAVKMTCRNASDIIITALETDGGFEIVKGG